MPPSSATAYQSLQTYKPREAKDVMTEAETKYDIPGYTNRLSSLRGLVGNLQSSVEAVDPSVTGRTTGNFTTEGQRSALVSRERAPILGDLSKQQGALSQEQAGFTNAQNLATQMASALMSQDQTTYQRLLDQYNAATASEAAAEQKRQYEANMAEQKRQFDEQQRTARATASGGGYDISKYLAGNTAAAATAEQATVNDKDAAYLGRLAAETDPILRQQLFSQLSNGNADAKRRYALASKLYPQYVSAPNTKGVTYSGGIGTSMKGLSF